MPCREFPITDSAGNLCTVPPVGGIPKQYFLTSAGDGTGEINLNGDYSAAAQDFYIEFPHYFSMKSLLISMSLQNKAELGVYGSIDVGPLTNGVKFFVQYPGQAEQQAFASLAFKCNCDWFRVAPETKLVPFEDTDKAARVLPVNINLFERYGSHLNVIPGTKLIARLNDDFTGLLSHTFNAGGTEYIL